MYVTYLWRNSQHLEGRRYVQAMGDLHVTEVHGEGLAPNSEVTELVNGQVTR